MWPNPHEIEDLVTLTEISLIDDFIFHAVVFKTLQRSSYYCERITPPSQL